MRLMGVAFGALVLAVACAQPAATSKTAPAPADTQALTSVFGSYRAHDGRVFVIARLGWFFDVRGATYRTIYSGAASNHFSIGPAFAIPLPKYADLIFDGTTLTVTTARATVSAQRVQYIQTDVTIPADGALLAGAITETIGSGMHPGIVIVHGSEQGERHFYDIWVGIYAGLGLTVLTYDKRGIGSSTGRYPGEFPTDESLRIYADDAAASLGFLSRWPGVDPKRVGFHGGSQGGWTVPLAVHRHGLASFALLVFGPGYHGGTDQSMEGLQRGRRLRPDSVVGGDGRRGPRRSFRLRPGTRAHRAAGPDVVAAGQQRSDGADPYLRGDPGRPPQAQLHGPDDPHRAWLAGQPDRPRCRRPAFPRARAGAGADHHGLVRRPIMSAS